MGPKPNKAALKKLQEEQKRAADKAEEERKKKEDIENEKWRTGLDFMKDTMPKLRANPWIMIHQPDVINDFLEIVIDTLSNLSKHEADLDKVKKVLQEVYEGMLDIGKFARNMPGFYISHPKSLRRFVRLLEQVAHKGSDKALYPNILHLLTPTFERVHFHEYLAEIRIVTPLMSFARAVWTPTPATLNLLLTIYKTLAVTPKIREMMMEDPGFERLQQLSIGVIPEFTRDQQDWAQLALSAFPPPNVDDLSRMQVQATGNASKESAEEEPTNDGSDTARSNAGAAESTS